MTEDNQNYEEEIQGEQLASEEVNESAEETQEPEYESGASDDSLAEQEPEAPVRENNVIRSRLEAAKRKAQKENEEKFRRLEQSNEELKELILSLKRKDEPQEDDEPEIDPRQAQLLSKIVKDSIIDIAREGEESEQQAHDNRLAAEAAQIAAEKEEIAADCMAKMEQAPTRFADFSEVIEKAAVPFDSIMTECVVNSEDAVAFLYNAAKYHKSALDRISNIRSPTAKIQEMTRLNDRIMSKITPRRHTESPAPMSAPRAAMYSSSVPTIDEIYRNKNNGKVYRD